MAASGDSVLGSVEKTLDCVNGVKGFRVAIVQQIHGNEPEEH